MKLKFFVALVVIADALTRRTPAQTNDTKDLRKVGGEVYDVTTSKDWVSITLPAGTGLYDGRTIHFNGTVQPMDLRFTIPNGNFSPPIRYEIVAEQIEDDKIVCDFDAVTYWFETWTGKPQDESRQTLKAIVIYHYPNPRALVTGQIIVGVVNGAPVSFLAMRVQNFIENGLSLEAYDCGVPSKNIVP